MRPRWHNYFFNLAYDVAKRGTCDRLQVGAIITHNNSIISTGYNGSLSGTSHCDDDGHLLVDNHCIRTIHAEINAILQTTKYNGIPKNSTIYITHSPCVECFKAILATNK